MRRPPRSTLFPYPTLFRSRVWPARNQPVIRFWTSSRARGRPMSIVETEVEQPAAQGAAMEITVSRQELVKELTATQSVVERKTTIPILSNFLIEADGDRLTITATDLDQAIRTSAAVKVKKPGACTIPARKLYDYVKLLPDGDISIKLLDNHWVQIRSGRSNTKMVGMARANRSEERRVGKECRSRWSPDH